MELITCNQFPLCYDPSHFHENTTNAKYAQHILKTGNSYSKKEDTIKIFKIAKKGSYMNTLERFHMQKQH
jgi:hypothetical protein